MNSEKGTLIFVAGLATLVATVIITHHGRLDPNTAKTYKRIIDDKDKFYSKLLEDKDRFHYEDRRRVAGMTKDCLEVHYKRKEDKDTFYKNALRCTDIINPD